MISIHPVALTILDNLINAVSKRVAGDENLVGIVIPTLGVRADLLFVCLSSVRRAGVDFVLIVAPIEIDLMAYIELGLVDKVIPDTKKGLAAAINAGIESLPADVSIVGWLGDDDYLLTSSCKQYVEALANSSSSVMAYGSCRYVDIQGRQIWQNRSGQFASKILLFGPCLIPQPGSLIKRTAFESVGGLNENLGWAFDLDLFIKLSKIGTLQFIRQEVAAFRWHAGSLTVSSRKKSVIEASSVRLSHINPILRKLSFLWEPIIRMITLHSRVLVSDKNNKVKSK